MGVTLSALVEVHDGKSWDRVTEFDFGKDYTLAMWLADQEWSTDHWPQYHCHIPSGVYSPKVACWDSWKLWTEDGVSGTFQAEFGHLLKGDPPDFGPVTPPEYTSHVWRALLLVVWACESAGLQTRVLFWRD